MNPRALATLAALLALVLPNAAAAYIGPGAGLSAIGTAVAVVGAILLMIIGFVWYPIRRLLRRGRSGSSAETPEQKS